MTEPRLHHSLKMKALFLPHALRYDYFVSFLKEAKEKCEWTCSVIYTSQESKAFTKLIYPGGTGFEIPDFSRSQPWERRQFNRDEIGKLITSCERASGIPVNRMLLAGERSIGRAYSREFYHFPERALAKSVIRKPEISQVYIERIFHFLKEIFETYNPDIIIGGAISTPVGIALWMLSVLKRVPFLINRRSKIVPRKCYWTRDFSMLSELTQEKYKSLCSIESEISQEAKSYLFNISREPETIDYIRDQWDFMYQSERFWPSHVRSVKLTAVWARYFLKKKNGEKPKPFWPSFAEYYKSRYLRSRQNGMLKSFREEELQRRSYVYFPLHKEPELAINFQAYPWHSQKETVKFLSTILPYGCELLVREHRGTWGRRPTKFYQYLRSLPSVHLVHPLDNQFKYIRNANIVITDNGSSGWEGIALRRPTITLHDSFYSISGLSHQVKDRSELQTTLLSIFHSDKVNSIDEPEYSNRIAWLYDAENSICVDDYQGPHDDSFHIIDTLLRR